MWYVLCLNFEFSIFSNREARNLAWENTFHSQFQNYFALSSLFLPRPIIFHSNSPTKGLQRPIFWLYDSFLPPTTIIFSFHPPCPPFPYLQVFFCIQVQWNALYLLSESWKRNYPGCFTAITNKEKPYHH